ncbi:MAG: sensor histidine kinase, partial [Bacteroidia bacterium]|nr:sensor histidine kinase [Bacteroidia bacterium]
HWKIPSLLIQPFVENAVKHGLLNKKGKKQVHVRFTQENPAQLCIAIEDNGIGRKASREINSMRKDKPKSFATPAIQARINLLNQLHPGKLSLEIIDLYENSMPSGTRVELRITL